MSDNTSISSSKKTSNPLVQNYPRIVIVFQPNRSAELHLIEVIWMWLQRKAINNSTFRNESNIVKAVYDWTCEYNNSHGNITIEVYRINSTFIYITQPKL